MGAEFNEHTFTACSEESLTDQVEDMCHDAQARLGYEYSGSWGSCNGFGVIIKDHTFLDKYEAFEWLYDNHSKWDAPWAVKFSEIELTPEIEKAQARRVALNKALRNITGFRGEVYLVHSAAFARVQKSKSRLCACPECDSRLAVKHLRGNNCPVCEAKELFLTGADKRKLISLHKREVRIEQTLAQQEKYIEKLEQTETKKQTKWTWAVGAWCSS